MSYRTPPEDDDEAGGDGSSTGAPSWRHREEGWLELLRFLPDVGRLLADLARDDRVSLRTKALAFGTLAYVMSPVDVVPDFLGPLGKLDDIFLATRALRFLVQEAGYDVVHELWGGSDDGFALLLMVAGVED